MQFDPDRKSVGKVLIENCTFWTGPLPGDASKVGVRLEDKIRDLKIRNLAFGDGVGRKYHMVGKGPFPGYDNQGESKAAPFETMLKNGWK